MTLRNTLIALFALVLLSAYLVLERDTEQAPPPADATAVTTDPRFSQPDGWAWRYLQTDHGTRIRFGQINHSQPRGIVVLLPGYSAPLEIYFEPIREFIDAGFTVIGLDWPSQGGSSRTLANTQKIHTDTFDEHLLAAEAFLDKALATKSPLPVFLVGSSMGGQLGARLLAQRPDFFSAAVLVTPAFEIETGAPAWLSGATLALGDISGFSTAYAPGQADWQFDHDAFNGIANTCMHTNTRTKLWYAWMLKKPELKVGGGTYAFMRAMIRSAKISRSPEVLSLIKTPVLMSVAGEDYFVKTPAAVSACDQIDNCSLQQFDGAKHCLFEEIDEFRLPFMSGILEFLRSHAAAEQ